MQAPVTSIPNTLPGPFATAPDPAALRPSPATRALVKEQVRALLDASPAFHEIGQEKRRDLARDLTRIGAYAAECVREMCWQSKKLGQTPVVRHRRTMQPALAGALGAGDFKASAASKIAKVTEQTLRAVAFPRFVADLIRGTFNAITQTNIQQMEAFSAMVANVSMTVDEFMAANISDFQARDWLAQRYPEHIEVRDGKAMTKGDANEDRTPNFRAELKLNENVDLDDDAIEETLVPAARRRLAETRLQMLSTLVLMGVNRIVVTGGKIRATMGFHIDTSDRAHKEEATDLDTRVAAAGSFGFGPWSASASMSVSYVRSTRGTSDSELNVETDLTGEVEIHFQSDYFPVERFADAATLGRIADNTAVPSTNRPANPLGGKPATGGGYTTFQSPRTHRKGPVQPSYAPIQTKNREEKRPVQPTAPDVSGNKNQETASPPGSNAQPVEG